MDFPRPSSVSAVLRSSLATRLAAWSSSLPPVVIGFDGFVDEMIRLVGERRGLDDYVPVPTIAAFGDLVTRAAGHSSLREIVVTAVHPGGCAINMGDGLAALGVPVDCFATLGEPPHPAFGAVTGRFRSTRSWGREPGRTLAYEFTDGKLMFSSVTPLAEFTPQKLDAVLADGAFESACRHSPLIAMTNWTLYPHMTAIWRRLQETVFARLSHRPAFFVDLVDPSSRTVADIRAMLDTLAGFEQAGPLTLGLNGNEANIIARLLDLPPCTEADVTSTRRLAEALRARLAIAAVVIHHVRTAAVAAPDGEAEMAGPYCPHPLKSTGAGDRFNAGYALGLLLGLDPTERLLTACSSSGFFVRHARSADLDELAAFLAHPDWP